jgi:hypothetical protein
MHFFGLIGVIALLALHAFGERGAQIVAQLILLSGALFVAAFLGTVLLNGPVWW